MPLLLVDRVGVLAALYGAGSMAYVGGGFGRAGLHSVLEPAAWGVPVGFGPRWRESRDAGLLLAAEAALALPARSGRRRRGLADWWERGWPTGPRESGSRAARAGGGGVRSGRRAAIGRDAGRAYFVTTPSKVTERGTMRPRVSTGDEHVDEPAPGVDLHVGDALAAAELRGQRLPQRRLLDPEHAPEAVDGVAGDGEALALRGLAGGRRHA